MDKNKFDEDHLPTFLKEMKKENPFQVPHNYFKQLPDRIMEEIIKEDQSKSSGQQAWWQQVEEIFAKLWAPKPILALASLLMLLGVWFFWPSQSQTDLFAEFSQDEIQQYVLENLDEFDEQYFYDVDPSALITIENGWNQDEMDDILDQIIDDLDEETLQNFL